MAHDFNNILAVILGNLQLLQREFRNDGRSARRAAAAAVAAAERGAKLTNRLLAFARQQVLETRPVNANALTMELKELLSRTLGETISLRTELDHRIWTIRASGYAQANFLHNGGVQGRARLVNKPFRQEVLAKKVRQALDSPIGDRAAVLIIDDDPQIRDVWNEVLTDAGFKVHVAPSGVEASGWRKASRSMWSSRTS